MMRPTPRATRTVTRFPYATLFQSPLPPANPPRLGIHRTSRLRFVLRQRDHGRHAQPGGRGLDAMTRPQLEAGGSGIGRQGASGDWVSVLRRSLAAIAVGNLVWEYAQHPL